MTQKAANEMRDFQTVIASAAKHPSAEYGGVWIASSRSLSSGAPSRDPLAPRNDEKMAYST
jgi:hypothetical protein